MNIGYIIQNVLDESIFGQVVEWLMAPDCKSGRESVRWFESISAHHIYFKRDTWKSILFLLRQM